jgi:hypothetical protein
MQQVGVASNHLRSPTAMFALPPPSRHVRCATNFESLLG